MQIRYMETHQPPVRLIAPGRVYRRDNLDLTHTPMFTQVEGLVVGEGISLARSQGHADRLRARAVRRRARSVRFRPSFFPYTEPSAEVDISCGACDGAGCAMCKQTGWLEILAAAWCTRRCSKPSATTPSGTPASPSAWASSAWRSSKWGVEDIRLFYENDLRFLEQFPL